jgi:sigma-E factor negative regulatory protein RseC
MKKEFEGVVIETNGNTAKVRTSIHNDCENCGFCPGNNAMIFEVINKVGAKVGQRIIIEKNETNTLLAAFIIYILPLVVIGCGIYLGYYLSSRLLFSADLLMIIGGVVFGLPMIVFVRRLDRSLQSQKPIIIKVKGE